MILACTGATPTAWFVDDSAPRFSLCNHLRMLCELSERTWAALPKLGDSHDNGPPWALLDSFVNRFSAPDASELYLIPD